MIRSYTTRQEIIQSASHLRSVLARSKQVSHRLNELKETFLKNIEKTYRQQNHSAAKAKRLALLDPKYHDFLKELIVVNEGYYRARIEWDMLVMKRDCEKSSQSSF